jgi:two-component system chemotaxis response regulator CheY
MIRLLVVDDAPFVREIVRHAVKLSNIEIVGEAENGNDAVTMATDLKPDVILMDIVLPEKNGIEASRELFQQNSNIRIVAFSTNDSDSMIMKALDAGCVSFLAKPFQAKELVAAITQAAENRNQSAITG